jgi:hypothetical protein
MLTIMRFPISLLFCCLLAQPAAFAGVRAAEDSANATRTCVAMTVSASDIASFGDRGRQQYRIRFENRCDTVRIVYWCAENPSKTLSTNSPCVQAGAPGGIAAPLYAVVRQREFQWTFPPGTRIRYVDCSDSAYPTSDFRCRPAVSQR